MNIVSDIEEHKPAELNRLLAKLYAEVKNKNGQDYVDCKRPGIPPVETGLGGKREITTTSWSR